MLFKLEGSLACCLLEGESFFFLCGGVGGNPRRRDSARFGGGRGHQARSVQDPGGEISSLRERQASPAVMLAREITE